LAKLLAIKQIQLLWLKRNLRLQDNELFALKNSSETPFILIYCFEPSLMQHADSDDRHWRFVYQSLVDLQKQLQPHKIKLHLFYGEFLPLLQDISALYTITRIYSHEETGNNLSFERDKAVAAFCQENAIEWKEFSTNAIVRGLKNRNNWDTLWHNTMQRQIVGFDGNDFFASLIAEEIAQKYNIAALPAPVTNANKNFQQGGETLAWKYLKSFIEEERYLNYSKHISKPLDSRKSCTRLSAYLAYGNVSIRQVHQFILFNYATSKNKRALSALLSRLHWHCHFIQKFEMECSMEFKSLNKAYDRIEKPINAEFIKAWEQGKTGVPLVDACMRCVVATGYLNFRMRAMVVSFFVYNLWQPWQAMAHFLARQFLDYEPGIHYPQIQMQAAAMGMHTVRMYNPTKNALQHDAEAAFIKQWLPELKNISIPLVFEPWKMTEQDEALYNCTLGIDYPKPIVDIEASRKYAADIIWSYKKQPETKANAKKILAKHVKPASNKPTIQKKVSKKAVKAKATVVQGQLPLE
jgi:deoxyribodipyrimidine photo-lyase